MRHLIILLLNLTIFASCFQKSKDIKLNDDFINRTGLKFIDSAYNIENRNTYSFNEGEYSLVFKITKSQLNAWLNSTPPWENRIWTKGPIPHEIGIACQFNFPDRVGVGTDKRGIEDYYGDENLKRLLNDSTNFFTVREDCCPGEDRLRFHAGALLILSPSSNMVYYSNWKY